jgi:ADP-glucose pyrophosphorylase
VGREAADAAHGRPREAGGAVRGHLPLIDFALSNVVNSGYLKVVVLTQYKSHSLDRHVTQTWRMSTMLGNYVAPVPASSGWASTGTSAAPTRSSSP